jgi:transcription factor E2F3
VQNETLIAIKAPHGTTLEVPDPDEVGSIKINELCIHKLLTVFLFMVLVCLLLHGQAGDYLQRRYRIVLRSTMGPIDVYLVR